MAQKKGKPSTVPGHSPIDSFEEKAVRLSESHQMTLDRPFGSKESAELPSISIEYHLTIRLKNQSLTRRDLSLLLDILNYQAVNYGVNFVMFLTLYDLYFRLLGTKRSAREIREPRIRLTVSVSELLLRFFKNSDWSLYQNQVLEVSTSLRKLLVKGLMSKRTYGSRFRSWRPEKFFEVRIVPVDIQFLKRRDNSDRYSGYCKGYGESHPSAHKNRTAPSVELDGSDFDPVEDQERKFFEICTEPIHVLSNYLLLKYEELEREEK